MKKTDTLEELHKKAHERRDDYEEDWENEEVPSEEENEFNLDLVKRRFIYENYR